VVELEEAEWESALRVSLTAIFLASKYAIPAMIERGGGSIINISSVHGLLARTENSAYSTVKAGMLHLTRQMAVDYGPHNIRVNAICPGGVILPRNEEHHRERAADAEYQRRAKVVYPLLGRPAYAVEIAKAALFLASEDGSYVTGNTLVLDGGMTLQIQDTLSALIVEAVRAGEEG
jgi:NAD(P)-dependent dehydrogenase (short-subunit alcohol dehydrogenase family)